MVARSRRPLHWTDVPLVMSWAVAYPVAVAAVEATRWYYGPRHHVRTVLFLLHLYLMWLPGAVPIFLRLRRALPATPGMQSLLAAIVFAPGFAIYLFTPAVAQIVYGAYGWIVSPDSSTHLLVLLGLLPLLLTWFAVYLGMSAQAARRAHRSRVAR